MTVKTQDKRKMAITCTTLTSDDKKKLILFQIYLIYAERSLEDFYSSGMCTGIYISTVISAAADEGPDEMTFFAAGLHYLLTFPTRMSKITQKSVCLYANFSEKGCLDLSGDTCISLYMRTFPKGRIVWIV